MDYNKLFKRNKIPDPTEARIEDALSVKITPSSNKPT